MASKTTYLKMVKPGYTEKFDIMTINQNMDTIDAAVNAAATGKIDKPSGIAANKYLRTTRSGNLEWADSVDQAQIGPAVTEWLDDNIPSGQTVVVDPTLSMSQCAADAKVVGDELADMIADDTTGIVIKIRN